MVEPRAEADGLAVNGRHSFDVLRGESHIKALQCGSILLIGLPSTLRPYPPDRPPNSRLAAGNRHDLAL